MEVTGTIIKINIPKTGTSQSGKDWMSQEVVIETTEQYPKKICLQTFNKTVLEALENYKVGYKITASINIESKEVNGNWFTNVQMWKIAGDAINGRD